MSLPALLLVDDSEAVLAFERAALAGHYAMTTANNGREALASLRRTSPAAVLLDLSMPQMGGDELLARMQADASLRAIPVIIVSSEKRRAEACLRAGAKAFLPKPIRAPELLALVAKVLDDARREQRAGDLAALFVGVGGLELGVPLELVETVLHQIASRPLPAGPRFADRFVEIHGRPAAVIDLAGCLGVFHAARPDEQKLVVVVHGGVRLALSVDFVRDPVEVRAADLLPADRWPPLPALPAGATAAVASTEGGPIPIVLPHALLPAGAREALANLLAASLPPATSAVARP